MSATKKQQAETKIKQEGVDVAQGQVKKAAKVQVEEKAVAASNNASDKAENVSKAREEKDNTESPNGPVKTQSTEKSQGNTKGGQNDTQANIKTTLKKTDGEEVTGGDKASDNHVTSESKDETLVITTEDDIDVALNSENKQSKTSTESGEVIKPKSRSMWVSNIAKTIRATDLKRFFSKHGRVITAKIVTNGKSYFGYVCMDSIKNVENCIKYLNHTRLGDKKITISSDRPDTPKKKPAVVKKVADTPPKEDTSTAAVDDETSKPDPLTLVVKKTTEAKKDTPKVEKPARQLIVAPKKDETIPLKREIKLLRMDLQKARQRLRDEEGRSHGLQMKVKRMQKGLQDLEEKLRQERKMFDKERESLTKKNRVEEIKLEAQRELLEKERVDLRKRHDDLEREMRKVSELQKAVEMQQRSFNRSRKSRSLSPRNVSNNSAKRMKLNDSRHEFKKARWVGERARTPPPPPKLSPPREAPRSKRAHDHGVYEERMSRRDASVYVPTGSFSESRGEERHRSGFVTETKSVIVVPSRGGWVDSTTADQWRSQGGGDSRMAPQYNDRYREPYRGPQNYSGQPRNETHQYSRVSDPEYRRPVHYEGNQRKY